MRVIRLKFVDSDRACKSSYPQPAPSLRLRNKQTFPTAKKNRREMSVHLNQIKRELMIWDTKPSAYVADMKRRSQKHLP